MAEKKEQTQQEQGENMVTVLLHKDNNENKDDMFVGVNLQDYHVPRGKPVEVPESVAHVIANTLAQENEAMEFIEANKSVHYNG